MSEVPLYSKLRRVYVLWGCARVSCSLPRPVAPPRPPVLTRLTPVNSRRIGLPHPPYPVARCRCVALCRMPCVPIVRTPPPVRRPVALGRVARGQIRRR